MSPIATVSNPAEFHVRQSADAACFYLSLDEQEFRAYIEAAGQWFNMTKVPERRRGYIVTMKPRTFEETARHFSSVAVPVSWPDPEPDVD